LKFVSQLFAYLSHGRKHEKGTAQEEILVRKIHYCQSVLDLFSFYESLVATGYTPLMQIPEEFSASLKFVHSYKKVIYGNSHGFILKTSDTSAEYWKESSLVLLVTSVLLGMLGQEIEVQEAQDVLSVTCHSKYFLTVT
jgi:hypothetical protein